MRVVSVHGAARASVALSVVAAAALDLRARTPRFDRDWRTGRKTLPLETREQPVTLVQCAWRALARPAAAFFRAAAICHTCLIPPRGCGVEEFAENQ